MEKKYDITAVSALTGILPNLIRAWERRYSAVIPERSSTNRRLYSESDIEKLRLLKRGTDKGLTISSISGLPIEQIKLLLVGDSVGSANKIPDNPELLKQYRDYEYHLGNCFEAIENIDANMLQVSFGKASIYLRDCEVINEVVIPLFSRVRELSKRGIFTRLQENLVVNVTTVFLENLINSISILENTEKVYVVRYEDSLSKLSSLIVNSLCKINGINSEILDVQNIQGDKTCSKTTSPIILSFIFSEERNSFSNRIKILKSNIEYNPKNRWFVFCTDTLMQQIQYKHIESIDISDIKKIRNLYDIT